MRKLVTLRKIEDIRPIENADAIEVATVGGWDVVVAKDQFDIGDWCCYFEIDSFLPAGNSAWQMLVDKQPKTYDNRLGHRLRTVKLRGQISQGFIVPIFNLPQVVGAIGINYDSLKGNLENLNSMFDLVSTFEKSKFDFIEAEASLIINEHLDEFADWEKINQIDFAELLGVVKYDPVMPADLSGVMKGNFPAFIPKTDQERCQNLTSRIFPDELDNMFEVTIKLDGTSCTMYHNSGEVGVCGRNYEFLLDDQNKVNTFVSVFKQLNLEKVLKTLGRNIALQGEMIGPGIQGNKEKLLMHKYFVYDIFDIDSQQYLTPNDRMEMFMEIKRMIIESGADPTCFEHVPVLINSSMQELNINNISELLECADGPSLTASLREGLVFKRVDGMFSFKAISNKWLLKNE